MLPRLRFWWRAIRRGLSSLNGATAWIGTIVLVLGAAAGVAVPLVFRVSNWVTAVVLTALFAAVVLEGSYQEWASADQARNAAVNALQRTMTTPPITLTVRPSTGHEEVEIRPLGNLDRRLTHGSHGNEIIF